MPNKMMQIKDYHSDAPVMVEVCKHPNRAGLVVEFRTKGQRFVVDLESLEDAIDSQVDE